ncbi:MAG: tetratricopeptide repeat protein [Bacteroidales bacterium]
MRQFSILIISVFLIFSFISPASAQSQIRQVPIGQKAQKKKASDQNLAILYYNQGEFEKAIPILERILETRSSQYIYSYLYRSLIKVEKYRDAEKWAKRMLKRQAHYVRFQVDYGYACLKQGNEKKAERIFKKIIEDMAPDRNQILQVGGSFISKELYNWAQKTYNVGTKKLKNSYNFYSELATLALYQGDMEKMITLYALQLKENPQKISYIKSRLQYYLAYDVEGSLGEMCRSVFLEASHKSPDNPSFLEMMLWISMQEKDYDMAMIQAKSLDMRFAKDGHYVLSLSQICLANDQLEAAKEGFAYLNKRYEKNPKISERAKAGWLQTQYKIYDNQHIYDKKKLQKLVSNSEQFLSEVQIMPSLFDLLTEMAEVQAYQLGQSDAALLWLNKAMDIPQLSKSMLAKLKLVVADIMVYKQDVWEAKLLYMQVEKDMKHEPIGHEAKFKNAQLSYYLGEFGWAKGLLDVLKSATTKFIANDAMDLSLRIKDNLKEDSIGNSLRVYAHAELLLKQKNFVQAKYLLDSLYTFTENHPLKGDILYLKADLNIQQGKTVDAEKCYTDLINDYPQELLADESIIKLARLKENEDKDYDGAMKLYEKIISDYPASIYINEAREKFRKLRGK